MPGYWKTFNCLSVCAIASLCWSGCSTSPAVVRQGDKVEMSFDCRLQGGGLAATTRPDASVAGETKSPLYLPRTGPETVKVTAGAASPQSADRDRVSFESEIVRRLALRIPGLHEREQAHWDLEAERYPVSAQDKKIVQLATVRKRKKEMRLTREEYAGRTGKTPEVGQPFVLDKMVPGQVSEVTEKEVVIRFSPVQGKDLTTPFGPVTVREQADRFELEIAAEKGRLLRTGSMVGRISAVDKESMTVDYGHPFADEKLICDVEVVKVEQQEAKEVPQPVPGLPRHGEASSSSLPAAPGVDPKIARQLDAALREQSAGNETAAGADSGSTAAAAANGDLATVQYAATLEDGSVFYSTRKEVAEDPAVKKAAWFAAPNSFAGESVPVGKAALLPGIGEALSGMIVGDRKRLVLPPEKAFGPKDPQKVLRLPLARTMPRKMTVSADAYVKRFNSFPVAGKEIPISPYFAARVTAIRDSEVDLLLLGEDGKIFNEPFGVTAIEVEGENITTVLKPVLGGSFPTPDGVGVIASSDATNFTVDMNNPLAGRTVTIDIELTALTKAASLPTGDIPWQEDHDAGLSLAKKDGKPAVLVLYAEWCGFCKKLFDETLPDPRIEILRDGFTWIKVNSDQQTELKKLYGQNGYPMIVLFKTDGSVARKLDGYQKASVLRAALQEVL